MQRIAVTGEVNLPFNCSANAVRVIIRHPNGTNLGPNPQGGHFISNNAARTLAQAGIINMNNESKCIIKKLHEIYGDLALHFTQLRVDRPNRLSFSDLEKRLRERIITIISPDAYSCVYRLMIAASRWKFTKSNHNTHVITDITDINQHGTYLEGKFDAPGASELLEYIGGRYRACPSCTYEGDGDVCYDYLQFLRDKDQANGHIDDISVTVVMPVMSENSTVVPPQQPTSIVYVW